MGPRKHRSLSGSSSRRLPSAATSRRPLISYKEMKRVDHEAVRDQAEAGDKGARSGCCSSQPPPPRGRDTSTAQVVDLSPPGHRWSKAKTPSIPATSDSRARAMTFTALG